jgi:hypothetical protein
LFTEVGQRFLDQRLTMRTANSTNESFSKRVVIFDDAVS